MKQFINLLRFEMRVLFFSPATYIAAVLFLSLMGFIYLFIVETYGQTPQENLSSTELFRIFWIPVFFVVPLLTMKSIAEERRLGTLETLLTTPVTPMAVVLSKFLSAYTFYMLIWLLTLTYPLIIHSLLNPSTPYQILTDQASLIGGFSFIALSGTLYLSLGMFTSSLSRNQLTSAMLSFTLLFVLLVGGRILAEVPIFENSWIKSLCLNSDYFQTFQHLEDFSRGIIDTRPFFLYLGNSLIILGLTSLIVEAKA